MSEAALSAPARSGRALWSANALPVAIFVIFAVTPLFAVFFTESFVLSIVTRVMIFLRRTRRLCGRYPVVARH
jgi:hypothetical protein